MSAPPNKTIWGKKEGVLGLSIGLITMREVPWESSQDLIRSTRDALVSGMMHPSGENDY